jgi:hypothetical protein
MKTPFRLLKRIALLALLAASASGLAISTGGTPRSHASGIVYPCYACISTGPTISAQYTSAYGGTEGYITGSNFTGYSTVLVRTYSPSSVLLSQVQVYTDFWGRITVSNFGYPACQSYYKVIAYNYGTGRWSNWVNVSWLNCLT